MPDLTRDAERSRAEKTALRNRLLTSRRALTPSALTSAAVAIQDQALSLVRREDRPLLAAYVPVGREPGGADLVVSLSAHAPVLLPVLLPDNDLDWAAYPSPTPSRLATGPREPLVTGPRGLLEPAGPRLGVTAVARARLVFVPALAVDRRGMRMGRGGGSYDRALARLTGDTFVVALLHDGELVDHVPAEPHDRPVHAAITPGAGLTVFGN
ncbi:5-formyltetrahydrofolate cyclo-ligase [Paractinoplanes lichenicola]|uniref:5-formyltetrahydrofolate cyclo-ligase n=1 Tax=Paractinoplanes lichenicola TaxID=2802976 RepID=A0ABS1VJP9_9ACTN|nr:5-formyltetrahydrofolate cyclo-ligase [Actinoplanes lichenicola]MBL7254736.1 5-formyltetrahydrofolate cyclo-ligase [Actinoplanes lichenicola]